MYLGADIPDHFLEWLNKQSNNSATLLYGASLLFKQHGNIDISSVMPAKIDYSYSMGEHTTNLTNQTPSDPVLPNSVPPGPKDEEKQSSTSPWAGIEDMEDDPYS
ncbi:hypothetical protein ABNF65_08460 [Paenibacillus larvae]